MIEVHHSTGERAPQRMVPPVDIAALRQREGWLWVDAVSPTAAEVALLATEFELEGIDVDDVLHETEYPNLEERRGYLFVIAHTPAVDMVRLRTVEIDAFLGRDFLITVRHEDSPGFDTVEQLSDAERIEGPDGFLAMLLDVFMRRMRVLVDSLDVAVDELETMAITGDPLVLEEIQVLRRDVVWLRRVLIPQRDVLRAMARATGYITNPQAVGVLDSSFDDCVRALEALDSARSLLGSALDTYRATVGERTNEVMKVLTVFAAIVLPLSLMAGIYGMNFARMPELEWEYGYYVLLGVMAVTGLGLWLYFANRGFIGRPRVPRLDRAVGRGLAAFVHLTLTPARSVLSRVVAADEDGRDS